MSTKQVFKVNFHDDTASNKKCLFYIFNLFCHRVESFSCWILLYDWIVSEILQISRDSKFLWTRITSYFINWKLFGPSFLRVVYNLRFVSCQFANIIVNYSASGTQLHLAAASHKAFCALNWSNYLDKLKQNLVISSTCHIYC